MRRLQLLSEKAWLERELANLPAKAALTRASVQARLASVDQELATLPERNETRRLTLGFDGEPVDGTRSIEAQFAGKAVSLFTEAVALTEAGFSFSLQAGGPIPGARDHRLRIVGSVRGSFGFELELPSSDGPKLFADKDPATEALDATVTMLERALSGDEDALSESLGVVDLRAAKKLGEFLKLTVDRRATFTLNDGSRRVTSDHTAARNAVAMLRDDNIVQEKVTLDATLTGLRASKPDFECKLNDGSVILGAVDLAAKVDALAALLNRAARFHFKSTTVHNTKPRFVLLGPVEAPEDPESAPVT